MKRTCIELRVMDYKSENTINLGDYDEFDDDLRGRIELLLSADCDVVLRPYTWSDGDED